MSGYPDWQRYSQWFGQPLFAASGYALGAGSHTDGPTQVGNWSSVVLYIAPTGGSVTATIRQTASGIDAALIADTVVSVPAGTVKAQSVVLLGNRVSLILQGNAGGETVTYALLPSNTSVNAATIGGSGVLNITPTALASWPPASPANGDVQVLELPSSYDPIGGKLTRWLCTYDATNAMWDVTGPPLAAEVATLESTASAAYVALATAGPAIVLPRPGDYDVEIGALIAQPNAVPTPRMSYDIGGTGAVDADAIEQPMASAGTTGPFTLSKRRRKVGLTAVTLTAKYKNTAANSSNFSDRRMFVHPVRIS